MGSGGPLSADVSEFSGGLGCEVPRRKQYIVFRTGEVADSRTLSCMLSLRKKLRVLKSGHCGLGYLDLGFGSDLAGVLAICMTRSSISKHVTGVWDVGY